MIRAIAPDVTIDLFSQRPSILNPLFHAVQRLHVAKPGSEPDLTEATREETALLGGIFAEKPVRWQDRKRMFSSHGSRAAAQQFVLDPNLVYTLELFEDKLIPATFE